MFIFYMGFPAPTNYSLGLIRSSSRGDLPARKQPYIPQQNLIFYKGVCIGGGGGRRGES